MARTGRTSAYGDAFAKKAYADPLLREEARLRLKVPHGNALYRAILKEFMEKYK